MKLNEFKIGDVILKENGPGPGNHLFGPIEFFAYENGLLFFAPVEMPETYIRQEEFLEKIKTVQIDGVKVQVFKFNSEDNDWFRFPTKTLGKIKAYIAIKYPDAVKHNVHKGVPSFHSPAPKFASGQIPTVEEDMLTPEELTEEQAEDLRPPKVPPQAPPDRQPDENSPKELFPPPGPPQSDQVSSDRGTGMVG